MTSYRYAHLISPVYEPNLVFARPDYVKMNSANVVPILIHFFAMEIAAERRGFVKVNSAKLARIWPRFSAYEVQFCIGKLTFVLYRIPT